MRLGRHTWMESKASLRDTEKNSIWMDTRNGCLTRMIGQTQIYACQMMSKDGYHMIKCFNQGMHDHCDIYDVVVIVHTHYLIQSERTWHQMMQHQWKQNNQRSQNTISLRSDWDQTTMIQSQHKYCHQTFSMLFDKKQCIQNEVCNHTTKSLMVSETMWSICEVVGKKHKSMQGKWQRCMRHDISCWQEKSWKTKKCMTRHWECLTNHLMKLQKRSKTRSLQISSPVDTIPLSLQENCLRSCETLQRKISISLKMWRGHQEVSSIYHRSFQRDLPKTFQHWWIHFEQSQERKELVHDMGCFTICNQKRHTFTRELIYMKDSCKSSLHTWMKCISWTIHWSRDTCQKHTVQWNDTIQAYECRFRI